MKGILGKKVGMTQLYTKEGKIVPITLIEAGPCTVLQLKEMSKDNYVAIKLGFSDKKENRTNKPDMGNYNKAKSKPKRLIREMRLESVEGYTVGQEIKIDIFKEGDYVDVTGISKGKGFQGGMKRWNWTSGNAGHGSMHHRRVGSIGASSFPSRVLKGQHMPGHLGSERVTVQNLKIIKVDKEYNLLAIKGTVPGHNNVSYC
jgi:large subunit ribosomal protein L3